MSIEEILQVLQRFNIETLILALVTYLITCVIKKLVPYNAKKIIPILPFIFGVTLFFVYAYFLLKCTDYLFVIKKGLQIGGVATFYYAIIKQLSKNGNLKSTVSDILKGILKTQSVSAVASKIINSFSSQNSDEQNQQKIAEIIAQNTSINNSECQIITGIILKEITNANKK
ncbi:MAG: hypothetical protein IKV61_00880 [Clostridia bacterium]|nr:hypothetical protein [Clostridia bacterium]